MFSVFLWDTRLTSLWCSVCSYGTPFWPVCGVQCSYGTPVWAVCGVQCVPVGPPFEQFVVFSVFLWDTRLNSLWCSVCSCGTPVWTVYGVQCVPVGHPFEQFVVFSVFLWDTRLSSLWCSVCSYGTPFWAVCDVQRVPMGHPFEQFVVFNVFLWNTRLTSLWGFGGVHCVPSPRCNRNGWMGVKHQVTYLLSVFLWDTYRPVYGGLVVCNVSTKPPQTGR